MITCAINFYKYNYNTEVFDAYNFIDARVIVHLFERVHVSVIALIKLHNIDKQQI